MICCIFSEKETNAVTFSSQTGALRQKKIIIDAYYFLLLTKVSNTNYHELSIIYHKKTLKYPALRTLRRGFLFQFAS